MAGMHMTNYKASSDCHISNTNFNYEGCDLAGLNLNGIDLQGDNLTMSNLSHVNFDGAYLEGATVTDATLKDVLTNKLTICTNGVHGPCTLRGLRGR